MDQAAAKVSSSMFSLLGFVRYLLEPAFQPKDMLVLLYPSAERAVMNEVIAIRIQTS